MKRGTCCATGDDRRAVEVKHRCAPVVEEGEGDIPSVALLEQGELREEAEVERADVPSLHDVRPGLERGLCCPPANCTTHCKAGKEPRGEGLTF